MLKNEGNIFRKIQILFYSKNPSRENVLKDLPIYRYTGVTLFFAGIFSALPTAAFLESFSKLPFWLSLILSVVITIALVFAEGYRYQLRKKYESENRADAFIEKKITFSTTAINLIRTTTIIGAAMIVYSSIMTIDAKKHTIAERQHIVNQMIGNEKRAMRESGASKQEISASVNQLLKKKLEIVNEKSDMSNKLLTDITFGVPFLYMLIVLIFGMFIGCVVDRIISIITIIHFSIKYDTAQAIVDGNFPIKLPMKDFVDHQKGASMNDKLNGKKKGRKPVSGGKFRTYISPEKKAAILQDCKEMTYTEGLYFGKPKFTEIAKKYGIERQTVYNIYTRETVNS